MHCFSTRPRLSEVRIVPCEDYRTDDWSRPDIYSTPPKGKKQIPKDQEFYGDSFDNSHSILEADDVTHARQRRILSHAFSEQALRDQEDLIHQYTDMLISRLHEQVNGPSSGKIDLVRWLNFTTFDSKFISSKNMQ